jgi:hypothetical protein
MILPRKGWRQIIAKSSKRNRDETPPQGKRMHSYHATLGEWQELAWQENERACVSRLRHVAALADYGEDKFKPCHEKVALQDGYNIAIPVIM